METIGYIFRILSHYHPFKVVYFVIQYFMIVCVSEKKKEKRMNGTIGALCACRRRANSDLSS